MGGGLFIYYSSLILTNTVLTQNTAATSLPDLATIPTSFGLAVSPWAGTNLLHFTLTGTLGIDAYFLAFTTNLTLPFSAWTVLTNGAVGQTNFDLPLPPYGSGFFGAGSALASTLGVSAGTGVTVANTLSTSLQGAVSDNLPYILNWSEVSGPSSAAFGSPQQAATTMTVGAYGTYVFQLTASDSQLTVSDVVTLTFTNPASTLTVSAGAPATVYDALTSSLAGTVTDSLPYTLNWTEVSGPTAANFGSPAQTATTVAVEAYGTYVFQLTASDTTQSVSNTVTLNFTNVPSTLSVSAGTGATYTIIYIPNEGPHGIYSYPTIPLLGAVTDALPCSVQWTEVSGPYSPGISYPNQAHASVIAPEAGTYVFKLTATDAEQTISSTVTNIVNLKTN